MQLYAVEPREDGTIAYAYETTWPFSWAECLAFLQALLHYDLVTGPSQPLRVLANSVDVTDALREARMSPIAARLGRIDGHTLVVEGYSQLMESTLRFSLRAEEQHCVLVALNGPAMHESQRVFDRYMDNLEIIAHIERIHSGSPRDRGTHNAATLF